MPFHKRVVEPQKIYQKSKKITVQDGHDAGEINNLISINGIVNQLCSLAKHADDIFAELESECKAVIDHTNSVKRKCALLEEKCLKLNHKTAKIPQGNLTEFSKQTNHFVTGVILDQQHFTDRSRPQCVQSRYDNATVNREKLRLTRDIYRKENQLTLLKSEPKIPNLELETRKPSLLAKYIEEKKNPWQRTRSVEFDEFVKNYCGEEIPLPSPDEVLRRHAKSQPSVLVPVDTSGQSFERMCQHRRSLQEIALRKKKRRVTISGGVPGDFINSFSLASTSDNNPSTIEFETFGGDDGDDSVFEFAISNTDGYSAGVDTSNSSKLDNGYGTLERSKNDVDTPKEEKSKRWSWRGSFRDLTRGSKKDKTRINARDKPESFNRSSSMPPNKHIENTPRLSSEPLSTRTLSQDTVQSLHSAKNGCLGFHRSRSGMSKRKDKKDDQPPTGGNIQNSVDVRHISGDIDYDDRENDANSKKEKPKLTRSQSLTRRLSRVFSVRLRSPSKKTNKEERHSSSGNWTASNDSIKQCSDSSSPEKNGSLGDSAVDIRVPPPPKRFMVLPDSRSRSGSLGEDSIHSNSSHPSQRSISLCDFRENFTKLDTNAWLQSLERDIHQFRGDDRPELTSNNLEEHNAKLLSKSCNLLLDEEQCSEFSVDQDGFYTSMHIDSGLRSMAGAAKSLDALSVSTTSSTLKYDPYSLSQSIDSVIHQQPQGAKTNKDTAAKTKEAKPKVKPVPPKRTTPLLKSKSSVSLNTQLATVMENPNEPNVPVQRKRYSTGSDSYTSSKLTIFSGESGSNLSMNSSPVSQSDQEPIYARVQRKTVIDATTYPSLCEITPVPSDDDRESVSRDSMINTTGTLLLSTVPSVWSEFKSPYSTINRHLNMTKRYSLTETNNNKTEIEPGAGDYSTLPSRFSAKKFLKRSMSEQPTSTQPITVNTDDSSNNANDTDHYNSWPRSPKNNDDTAGTKDKVQPPPPPPRHSSQLSLHNSTSMNSVNETTSLCSECRSRRSSGSSNQTLMGSNQSLTSAGNSSRSSGCNSRLPDKYQQHITVRPKCKGADGAMYSSQEHIYARVIVNIDDENTAVNSSGIHSNSAATINENPAHIYKNVPPPVYVNLEKPRPPTPERTYRHSGVYCQKVNPDHKSKPLPPTPVGNVNCNKEFSPPNAVPSTPLFRNHQDSHSKREPVVYASTNIVVSKKSERPSHYSVSSDPLGETIAITKTSSTVAAKAPMRSFSARRSEAHNSVFLKSDEAKIYNVHEDANACIYNQPTSPMKCFEGVLPRPYRAPQTGTASQRTSLSSKFASIRSGNRRFSADSEGTTKTPPQDPSLLVAQARRNSLPNAKVYNVPYKDSSKQQLQQLNYSSLKRPSTLNIKSSKTQSPYSCSSLPRSSRQTTPIVQPNCANKSDIQQTDSTWSTPVVSNSNSRTPTARDNHSVQILSSNNNDRVTTSLSVQLRHPNENSYNEQIQQRLNAMEKRLESRKTINRDSVSDIDEAQVMNILDSIRNTIKSIATKEADDNDSAIGSPESSSMFDSNTNTL